MGKLNEFSITFTSPQVVYYPGQQLAGWVTVDLNQPMEMRGIKVELTGKGSCHWTEEHTTGTGEDQQTETLHYKGKEKLVKSKQVVCGDMEEKFTLPDGRHMYQFSFTLPGILPSSFESNIGYIRYTVKAKIDKPWKFDHKVKRPFTVNDIIDPNNAMYLQPVGGDAHRDVGCLFCKAGPVDMTASIDRSCYCPGEAILITTNVQNQTTRDMENVHAKLIQTIQYHGKCKREDSDDEDDFDLHSGTKKTKQVVRERGRLVGPPVPRGEEAKWFNQPFGVPALPPSITNSKVITVHYKVKVVAAVPCAIDAVVKMHILLGTVPFMQSYGQAVSYDTQYDPSSAPPQSNFVGGLAYPPPQVSTFGYPDMAPPSYSAAVGDEGVNIAMGEKDQYTHGDMSYNPVYTFAQPYQGNYQAPPPLEYPTETQAIEVQPSPEHVELETKADLEQPVDEPPAAGDPAAPPADE